MAGGCTWQAGMHGGGHVWLGGVCMAGGLHGRGHAWHRDVHAGETVTEAGGKHPTGMQSC